MNYLAHLFLAQPNADSQFGNLLGDFRRNVDIDELPQAVKNGLKNHYLVDKFTDHHPLVKTGKQYFSPARRRFSGIALDVLFDHFLIRHWSTFKTQPFEEFKANSYTSLTDRIPNMPSHMQSVVTRITQDDWFKEYETIEGVGKALDNIALRIRFANNFNGSIEDIYNNYQELESIFLSFFPELVAHVIEYSPELKNRL